MGHPEILHPEKLHFCCKYTKTNSFVIQTDKKIHTHFEAEMWEILRQEAEL